MNRRLFRSRTDSVIGGVAGGVAEYLDVDPSIVRIVWAILAIVTGGIFFVLYLVMWVVVPEAPMGPYIPGPGGAPGWMPPSGDPVAGAPGAEPVGGEPLVGEGTDASAAPGGSPAAGTEAGAPTQAGWTQPGYGYGYGRHRHRRRSGNGGLIFGIILVALGAWFLLDNYIPGLRSDLLWPLGLVLVGLVLLVVSTRRNEER
jgi:phage shock protein C